MDGMDDAFLRTPNPSPPKKNEDRKEKNAYSEIQTLSLPFRTFPPNFPLKNLAAGKEEQCKHYILPSGPTVRRRKYTLFEYIVSLFDGLATD
jgi:hypothetical protein